MYLTVGLGTRTSSGTPTPAIIALMIADIWKTTPFVAIIVLAGLVMLPGDIYEAAEVDGSSGWSTFWRITVPLLRPTLALAVLFRVLQAFGLFDLPYVMTNGGPGTATTSLAILGYNAMFKNLVVRAGRGGGHHHRAAGAARLPDFAADLQGPGREGRKLMRKRKRTGWHRVINGVNISAFVVVAVRRAPLYWLIASSFKTPANRWAPARRSTSRTRSATQNYSQTRSSSTTSASTSATRSS